MVWVARHNASDGRVEADVDDDEDDDDFVKFGMDVILLAALLSSRASWLGCFFASTYPVVVLQQSSLINPEWSAYNFDMQKGANAAAL